MLLSPLGTNRLIVSYRMRLAAIAFAASLAGVCLALPAAAGADATIAPPPIYSTATGLPDGRVYEQVSPADKNGNQAGASTNETLEFGGLAHYALAAPDGNSVLFEGSGPMGETTAGYNLYFVAQRSAAGWSTRAIFPRTQQPTTTGTIGVQPDYVDPSSDLSHVMFKAEGGLFASPPYPQCGSEHNGDSQLYLGASEPLRAATWLDRPAEIANPIEVCARGEGGVVPVGGTPDFSTVYFTYPGTLLSEDASRAPYVTEPEEPQHVRLDDPWGFYEYTEGTLREAGVLPDGSLDPFGAVPAASGHGRGIAGNQIADEGRRAFFVSPDPASCGNGNNCAADPPQLYVRENGEKTVLVSQDRLLPPVDGLPAGAPDGALGFPGSTENEGSTVNTSFVYASPDGSQAFFESEDRLTEEAPEGPPGDTAPKMYDFDVETGKLTYLPGVVGQIVTSDQEGSAFAFVSPEGGASSAELELWSAGPGGGTLTPITQLAGQRAFGNNGKEELTDVPVARMSADGSVVVFMTAMHVPGGFNSGTGLEQIYRYDVLANTLGCVSCAPAGVTPTGNAEMSVLHASENNESFAGIQYYAGMVEEHGVSADGDKIFFDTGTPLVPQDTNTGSALIRFAGGSEFVEEEGRDVYEWENGTIYLISSGKSTLNSYFLDSSENGDDVFFATTEGLVPGDTDGAYDVYDARVPHPGDSSPPAAVPCEGSVCQGPPRVPAPLAAPTSATFSGPGDIAPEPAAKPAAKPKSTPKATKCKKGYVKKSKKCVKKPKAKKSAKGRK